MVGFSIFYYMFLDGALIERDVQLSGDGVFLEPELVLDENRGFKLHHPLYLVKSGIEVRF